MPASRSALLALVLCPTLAYAQVEPDSTKPTVDIQLFRPTADATGFFTTDSGEVNSHFGVNLGLNVNYGMSPLSVRVVRAGGAEEDIGAVVGYRLDANVLLSFGLFDIFELGAVVPFVLQGGQDSAAFRDADPPIDVGTDGLKNFTQGDARIVPKVSLLNVSNGLFAVAAVGNIIIPSAGGVAYAGEAAPAYGGALAVSTRSDRFRLGLNVGYLVRERTRVEGQTSAQPILLVDDELYGRLGVGVNFGSLEAPFELIGEVYGVTPANNPLGMYSPAASDDFQKARTAMEGVLGVRIYLLRSLLLTAGGGGGLLPGYGASAPRLFAGLSFYNGTFGLADADQDGVPDKSDKCVDRKEDRDDFQDDDGCPDLDNDTDGIVDDDDQCPIEAEDKDGISDDDGCPEPDNDSDGVLDTADKCPMQAEDKDSFQDEDGCPDLDNDGDGIADAVDKCPGEAEDVDGYEDSDGCPEPDNDGDGMPDLNDLCPNYAEDKDGVADDDGCPEDNDGDGIPDELDKCPKEAETYNGIDDADGCPEKLKAKSLVTVTEDKIEIKEKIFFKTGSAKILPKSFNLLDQVASVLKNYKHIKKVRVEGHTDNVGNKRKNKKLSQDRAESVREYLLGKGVEADRLVAEGFGQDKPIASNKTPRGKETNRRVEFVIVEQKPIGKDVAEGQTPATPPPPPPGAEPTFEMDLGIEAPPAEEKPADEPKKKGPKKAPEKADEGGEIEFNF
ncbi:MAG: OmpA family protein [Myxococcota bacterium]